MRCFQYLQKDLACKVESDADLLMSAAFQLKYNPRKMKKCVHSACRYDDLFIMSTYYVVMCITIHNFHVDWLIPYCLTASQNA